MPNFTLNLTAEQFLWLDELVGQEQSKCNLESAEAMLLGPPQSANPTDAEKQARAALVKPSSDREKAIYVICQAISAAWEASEAQRPTPAKEPQP